MLIEMPYKENDVVSLKLSSGEELVGKLYQDKDDIFIIEKPLSLTATQEGMGLAPFMFTVHHESKFYFHKTGVSCIAKTEETMAKNYIQSTTGLQV
jgi:hypothetical protein